MMLSILTVMNASAAEETLWEGDWNVSWNLPDGDEHKEWKGLGQADFASMEVGQKLYFYLTVVADADYHKYNFDNWSWAALPGHEDEHDDSFGFGEDTKVTFEVTQDIKDAIAANGFAMHGHGYHVVKVTKEVDEEPAVIEDLEATSLWQGEAVIDGWGANVLMVDAESGYLDIFAEKLTKACNLYFLVENATGGDFRIAGAWGDWGVTTYPADGHNHMQTLDADNVVKVALDADFVTQAFAEKGGVAFWGNGGFKIKAIGTTKDSVLPTTDINDINETEKRDNQYYDLNGQPVDDPTNGIYIINGKKVFVK